MGQKYSTLYYYLTHMCHSYDIFGVLQLIVCILCIVGFIVDRILINKVLCYVQEMSAFDTFKNNNIYSTICFPRSLRNSCLRSGFEFECSSTEISRFHDDLVCTRKFPFKNASRKLLEGKSSVRFRRRLCSMKV